MQEASMAKAGKWTQVWLPAERAELVHALRTAIAAVASLLIARLCKLPESYWAAITTMIVMQSTLGAALNISKQRLAGTALGAGMGALFATYPGTHIAVYGMGILLCGVICALVHVERNAFRYAGITLTVVLLISHAEPAWVVAVHRFIEISVGIVVGLLVTAAWPEAKPATR
jgi:uncharacterized membrane protein YccC